MKKSTMLSALIALAIAFSNLAGAQFFDPLFSDGFDPIGCANPDGMTREQRANITYGAIGAIYRLNVDVTEWDNVYGHGTPTDGVTPWPGVNGAGPVIRNLWRDQYLSLHFRTTDPPLHGQLAYASNIGGPNIEASITPYCGVFFTAVGGCYKAAAWSDDSPFLYWQINSTSTARCDLAPDTDYYLNIRYTETPPGRPCAFAPSCPFYSISNY